MSRSNVFSPRLLAASLVLAIGALSSNAFAYNPETREGELVQQIVLKWGTHVQDAYGIDVQDWTNEILPLLLKADADSLQRALDAPTFTAMNDALVPAPQTMSLDIGTLALGDIDKDLVYKPVTPCRIFDTRLPLPGNPIAAKTSRDFDVTSVATYSGQGGAATDCGIGGAASVAAVVVNFTVVDPSGDGYITAYPAGVSKPNAATVNFRAGSVVANNLSIVRLGQSAAQRELSVYADARTHVVGDIVGYFAAPQPTALECVQVKSPTVPAPAYPVPDVTVSVLAPDCAAGFTRTSVSCDAGIDVVLSNVGGLPSGKLCAGINKGTTTNYIEAISTCCRVPGR